jgi:alkylhydroperoxidase family enzyme
VGFGEYLVDARQGCARRAHARRDGVIARRLSHDGAARSLGSLIVAWHGITGVGLRSIAPDAFDALDRVSRQVPDAADPSLVELARRHIVGLLGVARSELGGNSVWSEDTAPVLAGWPSAPQLSATERVCADMAEQFVVDVGSTTSAQRVALIDALGSDAFGYVQVLYAIESGLRVRRALGQLFGVAPPPFAATNGEDTTLWSELEQLMRAVASMSALDPLTTELIRLRGARAHDCRLCKSRRHVAVIEAGADEATFDQIDSYESSDLTERHKVALRLTDAMIWQPAAYLAELPSQVRTTFSPEEALEIVLDVARNAANKIAVALGADQPNVVDAIEYFDIDGGGELILGVSPGFRPR